MNETGSNNLQNRSILTIQDVARKSCQLATFCSFFGPFLDFVLYGSQSLDFDAVFVGLVILNTFNRKNFVYIMGSLRWEGPKDDFENLFFGKISKNSNSFSPIEIYLLVSS